MDDGAFGTPRLLTRLAGLFYLLTIASGAFAEFFVRSALIVRDDPAATAANIVAHRAWYGLGLAMDLTMIVCYIVVTLLLYVLLSPAGRRTSLLAAFFGVVGLAVLGANSLNHVAALVLVDTPYLSALDPAARDALALAALRMHARGYDVADVFFGVYCLLIGYLTFRSGYLPRLIGAFLMVDGIGSLLHDFAVLILPTLARVIPDPAALSAFAELSLALWLLVVGVNAERWEQAVRGQRTW